MGCLARLGCLVVLAVLAVAAWFTRSQWLPMIRSRMAAETAAVPTWQRLTEAGAARADSALRRLQAPGGPMYVNATAGDLASYIARELTQTIPAFTDSLEAAAIDDRLHLRAFVRTADLGDRQSLGPLAVLLGERERLQMGGVLRIIRPGLAELQIKEFRIRDLALPQPLIPRIVQQIIRGERSPGLSEEGIPLATPDYIADVRVQNGLITLYKR
ncbi:MAG: hypothetical protein WD801_16770 [Gemmatimonadaceae bacterium]